MNKFNEAIDAWRTANNQQEHKMSEQTYTAMSIDNADNYSVLLASNVTLEAAQAAAQADDDDWRINGLISATAPLEWHATADGFEANGVSTISYMLTAHNAKLASTIVELESLLPFYLQQIAAWPFSNDGRWPSVVVNKCELSSGDEIMSDNSVDMTLLKIVVPLPTLLRADNVERLANVMLALSTNELGEITCAGQRWLIGDGDDTQAAWLANGSLHVWLRSWPSESADAIQQEQQLDGNENSDAVFYVLVSEADGEQMKLHGMFATSALAQAHAATLISDTYGSDATKLEWHSFDGGSEAEFNDDCGTWRFIALWHFSADVPA